MGYCSSAHCVSQFTELWPRFTSELSKGPVWIWDICSHQSIKFHYAPYIKIFSLHHLKSCTPRIRVTFSN